MTTKKTKKTPAPSEPSINFESDLTIQQQAFVNEYVVHFDATRAARTAGYSEKSVMSQACQLLKNPKVQKGINEALENYGLKHDVLKKRVLDQLANIAFSDITDFQEWSGDYATLKDSKGLTKGQRAAIQEVKVTTITKEDSATHSVHVKLCSKEKALELLGKHLGMFTDKIEHTMPRPLRIDYSDGTGVLLGAETTAKKN